MSKCCSWGGVFRKERSHSQGLGIQKFIGILNSLSKGDRWMIKGMSKYQISDLHGLSLTLHPWNHINPSGLSFSSVKLENKSHSYTDLILSLHWNLKRWASPEMLNGEIPTFKSDVFSFSTGIWEVKFYTSTLIWNRYTALDWLLMLDCQTMKWLLLLQRKMMIENS